MQTSNEDADELEDDHHDSVAGRDENAEDDDMDCARAADNDDVVTVMLLTRVLRC